MEEKRNAISMKPNTGLQVYVEETISKYQNGLHDDRGIATSIAIHPADITIFSTH